ncbi:MAG: PilZ domain-containing protein [Candidatus Hodarchaeales archaeon]|jgi:hypothetical protein
MIKRAYERIPVKLEGIFISNDTNCIAYIRNVSAFGVNAIITPLNCATDFLKEANYELIIHISSGETIKLNCLRKWSSSISPQGLTKEVGLEIIDPPNQYKEFLSTL